MFGCRIFFCTLVCATCLPACFANQPLTAMDGNTTLNTGGEGTDPTNPAVGTGGTGGTGGTDPTLPVGAQPVLPFEAQPARVFVRKVKNLLTGLPASSNEVTQGDSDTGLAALVDQWMALPQYQDVLLDFFGLAFQQSGFEMTQIADQVPYGNHGNGYDTQMLQEVFPRTALYFVNNNMPFNTLASTNQFMMNTRVLMHYALVDGFDVTDTGARSDYLMTLNPSFGYKLNPTTGATRIEDFINPSSSTYMTLRWSALSPPPSAQACNCSPNLCGYNGNTLNITKDTFTYNRSGDLFCLLQGSIMLFYTFPGNNYCYLPPANPGFMVDADYSWRMVTLRTPKNGEASAKVYDLPTFRTATSIPFRIPRVGYFTTPAFLGQWATNINNEARVTINQTMVVGLNKVFNGSDRTVASDLRAIPTAHADPASACYGCHLTMDPMRQYFRQALTVSFHPQLDKTQNDLPGVFAQAGVTASGGGLQQLGEQIANSSEFPLAWTMKVCAWLNSAPCAAKDPEVVRIAANFQKNNFNFNALVKELAVSPLTTYKASTLTATNRGTVATITRRGRLCQMLSARLGITDACNLKISTQAQGALAAAGALLKGYPADGYSRASVAMAQATQPSMPTRIGLENVCSYVAAQVVDNGSKPLFMSSNPKEAVDLLTTQLLGLSLTDDADVRALLMGHYTNATLGGASSGDAMRSTFVLACLSPYVALMGM